MGLMFIHIYLQGQNVSVCAPFKRWKQSNHTANASKQLTDKGIITKKFMSGTNVPEKKN